MLVDVPQEIEVLVFISSISIYLNSITIVFSIYRSELKHLFELKEKKKTVRNQKKLHMALL